MNSVIEAQEEYQKVREIWVPWNSFWFISNHGRDKTTLGEEEIIMDTTKNKPHVRENYRRTAWCMSASARSPSSSSKPVSWS